MIILITSLVAFSAGWIARPFARTSLISPTPSPRGTTYRSINIQEFPTFTVYRQPDLWEQAVDRTLVAEDFSADASDYGVLSFPYLTGHGLLLQGQSTAQIVNDPSLLMEGNLLHLRDFDGGLAVQFPNATAVQALAFEYRSPDPWLLEVNGSQINLLPGRKSFLGIVFRSDHPIEYRLRCIRAQQSGVSIDNISFATAPSR